MKTLADFKRDIKKGAILECDKIEEASILRTWEGGNISDAPYGPLAETELKEKMRGERIVTYVDTTGFYLNATPEDGERGSYFQFPKAKELEYDGERVIITEVSSAGYATQRRYYRIIKK